MTPRKPIGDKAMSAAERVRLSRWVNRVEDAADAMFELLSNAPKPLPRTPIINPELLDMLSEFVLDMDDAAAEDYPRERFLKLGNGNQVANKRRALACVADYFDGAEVLDRRTIKLPDWGECHFAAYTHMKGAMISTPGREDNSFGSADWHHRDHIVMFRDVGDGRCIIYICPIEPLFELRTIGHHGVTWGAISDAARHAEVISSADALRAESHNTNNRS